MAVSPRRCGRDCRPALRRARRRASLSSGKRRVERLVARLERCVRAGRLSGDFGLSETKSCGHDGAVGAADEIGEGPAVKHRQECAERFGGPRPFLRAVAQSLLSLGVPASQIRYEFFGPTDEALAA
jgi:hypothetical protein